MALESATYISDLNSSNPPGTDAMSTADDHLRLIKSTVKATFPNVSGAVTPTHTELNFVDGVTSAIQTQIAAIPGKNLVINGGFTVNQRVYVSTTATAAGTYMHDRWKSGTINSAYTFTQLASNTTIDITAGTIIQVIEDKMVQSTAYVLSWTGTATARYAVDSATPTGSYAASPILITGQTVGTTMSIEFETGTVGNVQLEAGTVAATSFEQRPFHAELALCQRYYQKSFTYAVAPAQNSGSSLGSVEFICAVTAQSQDTMVYLPVQMRAAPTITLYSPNAASANWGTNTDTPTASTGYIGDRSFGIRAATAMTAARAYDIHWQAVSEL